MKYPVYDKKGNVIKMVILHKNIDAEKDMEDRKNTFVATLTHDLKTPTLAQIKALDIILDKNFGDLAVNQRELLSQVKTSCKYMSELIFTILDTYKYDNGEIKIYTQEICLNDIVNNAIEHLSDFIKEKNQTIIVNNNSKSNIIADKSQIKRVVINLISNSITYGYPDSEIQINLLDDEKNIYFEIKNHSKYIPEERLVDIFEKYKKSDNTRFHKTSTGLGLYLSKQIIDAHNGNIYAQSDINETCTFGFSLPII